MEFRNVKRNADAKKASEVGNQSKLEKKSETSEQRLWRNTRFLKAVGTGLMLGMAGMSGVEARPEPSGSGIQSKGHDNTTGLPPQEFNNLSHPTAMEFNPYTYKVTPELLDHLRKVGVPDPEQHVRNVQQREQRQNIRRLAEKARENPEVLESVRKLFEEMPGKESSKTDRMKLDEGAERLTPDKIDPEVWKSVGRMLTEKTPISDQQNDVTRRELNSNTGTAVVFVHGIAGVDPLGGADNADCKDYWDTSIKYLQARGYSQFRTVQFYKDDTRCSDNLHDAIYTGPCKSFESGSEGSVNESLNHISCLLAQLLYKNFGESNKNVILVGHSMGGIIVRNTVYLTESYKGKSPFPSTIGHVTDAVTFNSPHEGVTALDVAIACGECNQVSQLIEGSTFMNNLIKNAQNPQTSAGFTQWTVVGSECDPVVAAIDNSAGASSAIAMQASHAIMYSNQDSTTCYNHTGALGDSSTKNDAILYQCDTNNPTGKPCGLTYEQYSGMVAAPGWTLTKKGAHGLQTLYEAVGQ